MNRIIFILALLLGSFNLSLSAQGEIQWMSWEQAMEKMEQKPRKMLVNVYTEWCNWCKRMDETTLQQSQIVNYINANYYPVKFDAERKKEITYQNKTYKYVKSGRRGYHELAADILRGRLSFPSIAFLDEDRNVIQSVSGYKTPRQFELIITYFAKDHYKNTPWSTYQASYTPITDR